MTRKSSKHCMQHMEQLDSCFDFIRFHQQCIGGARGVMVIVTGYGHSDMSSNPGPD